MMKLFERLADLIDALKCADSMDKVLIQLASMDALESLDAAMATYIDTTAKVPSKVNRVLIRIHDAPTV